MTSTFNVKQWSALLQALVELVYAQTQQVSASLATPPQQRLGAPMGKHALKRPMLVNAGQQIAEQKHHANGQMNPATTTPHSA